MIYEGILSKIKILVVRKVYSSCSEYIKIPLLYYENLRYDVEKF